MILLNIQCCRNRVCVVPQYIYERTNGLIQDNCGVCVYVYIYLHCMNIETAGSHILHPPSAPYFPRTSSPGTVDPQYHDQMTSLLNQTHPTPGSLSVTEIPISGNPNHSLQIPADHSSHFPIVQGPLRYVSQ